MKLMKKITAVVMAVAIMITMFDGVAFAAKKSGTPVGTKKEVKPIDDYYFWEGRSNICQFKDADGHFCFAYKYNGKVQVRVTEKGKVIKKFTLKMAHTMLGSVACDENGYYYVVTGRTNWSDDRNKETVFISKYSPKGKLLCTVGDSGDCSLAKYYDDKFNTSVPFDGGNCDIAINGNILAVNYARTMYNGHQSNSVFAINTDTMEKVRFDGIYCSHSFGQRAISYNDGFVFASEGDAYPRAFSITRTTSDSVVNDAEIFHFYLEPFSGGNMYVVNNNFASMGGIAQVSENTIAFVGQSVKALSSKAYSQPENIFIQIFDPDKALDSSEDFVTKGKRTGNSGRNGTDQVTDYGVKWLTSSKRYIYDCVQVAATESGKIVVLYAKYDKKNDYSYQGVCYVVLNQDGDIIQSETNFAPDARLNRYESPIVIGETIYWVGNRVYPGEHGYCLDVMMYVYHLTL